MLIIIFIKMIDLVFFFFKFILYLVSWFSIPTWICLIIFPKYINKSSLMICISQFYCIPYSYILDQFFFAQIILLSGLSSFIWNLIFYASIDLIKIWLLKKKKIIHSCKNFQKNMKFTILIQKSINLFLIKLFGKVQSV